MVHARGTRSSVASADSARVAARPRTVAEPMAQSRSAMPEMLPPRASSHLLRVSREEVVAGEGWLAGGAVAWCGLKGAARGAAVVLVAEALGARRGRRA